MSAAASTARSPSREAAVLLFGKVLGTLSEALIPLVIVRLWGKADVGVVSSAQLTYFALTTVLQAGFPEAATYFLPGREAAERWAITRHLGRVLLGVGALSAVILLGIAAAGAWFGSPEAGWAAGAALLPWFAAQALADLPSRMVTNVLVAEGRAAVTAALGVARALGTGLATLIPAVSGASPRVVVISSCAFAAAYALASLWVVRRHYQQVVVQETREALAATAQRPLETAPSPVSARELVRFSVPFGLTEIASIANSQLDRYFVIALFAVERFADYQAGAWTVPMIGSIPSIIAVAFTPQFVVWFREGRAQDVIAAWRRLACRTALLVTPLSAVFVVGAEETMRLLFTDAYAGSASIFRLYAVLMMIRVTPYGNVLLAAGRPGLITRASVLSVASNAVLTAICIWLVGLEGAALGTLLAFIPTALYYCMGIAAVTGVPLRSVYPLAAHARVIGVVALSSLPSLAIKWALPGGAGGSLALQALALGVTYAALGTWLGLIEADDWAVFRAWVRKTLKLDRPRASA